MCLAARMGWMIKQIGVASGVGAVAALGTLRSGVSLGGMFLVMPVGAVIGSLVGAVSVAGGSLALRSALVWPPRSTRWWRQRFAICSAAAVFLLMAAFFGWSVVSSAAQGYEPSGNVWFLGISVACAVVTYGCTIFLAPYAGSVEHR